MKGAAAAAAATAPEAPEATGGETEALAPVPPLRLDGLGCCWCTCAATRWHDGVVDAPCETDGAIIDWDL